jgi:ABC-type multidrug transport system ATPase subunit
MTEPPEQRATVRSDGTSGDGQPETDPPLAARVEGVGHDFGALTVLDGVSFEVPGRAVTALVGPNGSGKTTLLRIVGGLLRPTRGSVDRETGALRSVGYLPQSPAFRPTFTVRETVAFYADLLDETVDVDATIERVGMTDAADRRVEALSGGMTRLLGIAVAVLGDPPLVLLDEPTGDLDPLMTEHVFSVLSELSADVGVLLATHDLTGAAMADELLVLDRGTVAASGTPDALLDEHGVADLPALFRDVVGEDRTFVRVGGVGE